MREILLRSFYGDLANSKLPLPSKNPLLIYTYLINGIRSFYSEEKLKWVQNKVDACHSHMTCPYLISLLLILLIFFSFALLIGELVKLKRRFEILLFRFRLNGGNKVRRGKLLAVLLLSWILCSSSECRFLLVNIRLVNFSWIVLIVFWKFCLLVKKHYCNVFDFFCMSLLKKNGLLLMFLKFLLVNKIYTIVFY